MIRAFPFDHGTPKHWRYSAASILFTLCATFRTKMWTGFTCNQTRFTTTDYERTRTILTVPQVNPLSSCLVENNWGPQVMKCIDTYSLNCQILWFSHISRYLKAMWKVCPVFDNLYMRCGTVKDGSLITMLLGVQSSQWNNYGWSSVLTFTKLVVIPSWWLSRLAHQALSAWDSW